MAGDFYGDQYGGGNRRGDDGLGQDLRGSDGGNVGIAGVALGLPPAPTAPTLTAGEGGQRELDAEVQQLLRELADEIRADPTLLDFCRADPMLDFCKVYPMILDKLCSDPDAEQGA